MPNSGRYIDGSDDTAIQALVNRIAAIAPRAFRTQPQAAGGDVKRSETALKNRSCDDDSANAPLDLPTFSNAIDSIRAGTLFNRKLLEEALASLAKGHLILAGPPGTGKSRLARELAAKFNARLVEHTANPEWSVYDTIGSLALTSSNTLEPKDGLVTEALLDCCKAVAEHADDDTKPQAVWLLIDEMNRAEIDRAFGPLFTALADPLNGSLTLDYRSESRLLRVPRRFRIIATLNSFDTRFVNSMSAALRRRFGRVSVLPEPLSADGGISGEEFSLALSYAKAELSGSLDGAQITAGETFVNAHSGTMQKLIGHFRKSDTGGVPFGMAQVIDVLAYALTLYIVAGMPSDSTQQISLLDRAVAGRLVSSIESDATRGYLSIDWQKQFQESFSDFGETIARVDAFIAGRD